MPILITRDQLIEPYWLHFYEYFFVLFFFQENTKKRERESGNKKEKRKKEFPREKDAVKKKNEIAIVVKFDSWNEEPASKQR